MKYKIRDNKDQLSFSFRSKDWKTNPLLLLLMLTIFVFSGRAAYGVWQNRNESEKASLEKQSELAQLTNRQAFLSEELKRLNTAEGKESEFRKKFGVGLPGENVAIIVENAQASSTSAVSSFWQKVKDFFSKD